MGDISRESGTDNAAARAEQVLPLVYEELRHLAAAKISAERSDLTLQATALVHEAFLRLVENQPDREFCDRGDFFAAAAEAMRRILVDRARRKQRIKHGGELVRRRYAEDAILAPKIDDDLLSLDAALKDLQSLKPRMASLVKLRYFVGMTLREAADALGISQATADRDWAYAKAWLYRRLNESPSQ
jgi:RNA polymerase sigma factor (TIGR02999 family)